MEITAINGDPLPYLQGYDAGLNGRTANCNPYSIDDPSFEEWDEGHYEATIGWDE